jgi:hypothetical protein
LKLFHQSYSVRVMTGFSLIIGYIGIRIHELLFLVSLSLRARPNPY